ncbi:cytosolic phospholipase A2 gamma-like [Labrus bergylta]|uniref:cytosolic phospholipase A2 gamma-like n=1 Tax=Labrus bergylta TaxID=56723 RepID=UPI003314418E
MLCAGASRVSVLLCACSVMLGTLGQTGDPGDGQTPNAVRTEERRPTPETTREKNSTFSTKDHVRQSQALSAAEKEFILNRKRVSLKALNDLGVKCSLATVPHIAVLGSGGGQRAAVSLLGSLHQMEKDGLLDSVLYLGGVSGSVWSMASLYTDPQWSKNVGGAVSRLSGPEISPEQVLSWLSEAAKDEQFSLSDIWGLLTSAGIMKQLDHQRLSGVVTNAVNPYPIYNAMNQNCLKGPEKGKWFELTPHESGFTDLGLFVNSSLLGSRVHEAASGGQREMDLVRLQGIVGSVLSDEQTVLNSLPQQLKDLAGAAVTDENNLLDVIFLWTEAPQQVSGFFQVLDRYARAYHTLLKVTDIIKRYTKDPKVISDLNKLQKTMRENLNLNPAAWFGKKSPKQRKLILDRWSQKILEPLQSWSQSLDEGPVKDYVSLLPQKVFPAIGKWEWETIENFLFLYPDASVPSCVRLKQRLQLIDAGLMLNMAFPPLLGEKREVDLLIALDYSASEAFTTLTAARDYAAKLKKPFPEIDEKILLEERDCPKDFYVFEGKEKEPTIVFMPLFNRNNCKDAEEVKTKMAACSTFQPPFSQEKVEFLLETAKENVKRNKETLLREIKKAAERRRSRRSKEVRHLNLKTFTTRRH